MSLKSKFTKDLIIRPKNELTSLFILFKKQ